MGDRLSALDDCAVWENQREEGRSFHPVKRGWRPRKSEIILTFICKTDWKSRVTMRPLQREEKEQTVLMGASLVHYRQKNILNHGANGANDKIGEGANHK